MGMSHIELALREALRMTAAQNMIPLDDWTDMPDQELVDTEPYQCRWEVRLAKDAQVRWRMDVNAAERLGRGLESFFPSASSHYGIPTAYEEDHWEWALHGQVAFATYRLDFVVRTPAAIFVVECDGHDFHDRTKQQAAYDRARDRELLLAGIPTIRFTGSEIHHSAERCAAQVWAVGDALGSRRVGA